MVRLIPRLEIKGPRLVKGIHLEGLRVLGSPAAFARHYYDEGADELFYVDVVASLYQRDSILEIVEQTAREVFIPLTVGGGLRTVEDMKTMLRAGADKLALNTAVIRNPDLIREAATRFGSSTIVVAIEAKKHPDGSYEAYTDNGRERTGVDAIQWARRAAELGAGEVIVTSIDREGTGTGYDIELVRKVVDAVSVPVIACGGAGNVQHVLEVIRETAVSAVALSSLLHYRVVKQRPEAPPGSGGSVLGDGRRGSSRISDVGLPELKRFLRAQGVESRPAAALAEDG